MYYPNAARVQQFQANFLRKMANAGTPTEQKPKNQIPTNQDPLNKPVPTAAEKELARLTDLGYSMEDAVQQTLFEKRKREDPAFRAQVGQYERERIKQVLKAYAPYVGGGLALGSILGGLVGSRYNNTLAGGLLGGLAGAGLAGAGKYAYDKYRAGQQANRVAVG